MVRSGAARLAIVGVVTASLVSCAGHGSAPPAPAQPTTVALPAPDTHGTMPLESALAQRRSIRTFAPTPLRLDEVGQLLWAGQGITALDGKRTAPSAGALYPLDLYAVGAGQVVRYLPHGHRVEIRESRDLRGDLAGAALGQDAVKSAPTVIVIVATPARTAAKYGSRTSDYVRLEAGHAAQNILLQATAIGLGAVPIGAFDADKVREILALPRGQLPIYVIPVGHAP